MVIELSGKHNGEPLLATLSITDWTTAYRGSAESPPEPAIPIWDVEGITETQQKLYLDDLVEAVDAMFIAMGEKDDPRDEYDPDDSY